MVGLIVEVFCEAIIMGVDGYNVCSVVYNWGMKWRLPASLASVLYF
jgi:hypothetical protein